jgi:hypothetical protein
MEENFLEEKYNEQSGGKKIKTAKTQEQLDVELKDDLRVEASKIGFRPLTITNLPSTGMFYPLNTSIEYRAASLEEIKHYSSMNEEDLKDVMDKTASVLSHCMKISVGGSPRSYRDLIEFDKIYMVFLIRDLSMLVHGRENKLIQEIECEECGNKEKTELSNNIFSFHSISDKLTRFFNPDESCFVFNDAEMNVNNLKVYVPTIGSNEFIVNYIRSKETEKRNEQRTIYYDKGFLRVLPFIAKDHRELSNERSLAKYHKYYANLTYDEHVLLDKLVEKINLGIKPAIDTICKKTGCGHTNRNLIRFRGGVRSILNLSSVTEKFDID